MPRNGRRTTRTPSPTSPISAPSPAAPAGDAAAKRRPLRRSHRPAAPMREKEVDAQGRAYATGRRKDAVARVWLKPGTGKITVNGRDQEVYFARPTLRLVINQPFDRRARGPVRRRLHRQGRRAFGPGRSGQATASARRWRSSSRRCAARSRPPASSPATRAWSSARSTAAPRPAAASSSPSANGYPHEHAKGRLQGAALFIFGPYCARTEGACRRSAARRPRPVRPGRRRRCRSSRVSMCIQRFTSGSAPGPRG